MATGRVASPLSSNRPRASSTNGRPQPTSVTAASGSSSYARTAATELCGSAIFSAPATSSTSPRHHPRAGRQGHPGPHRDRSTSNPKSWIRSSIAVSGVQITSPEVWSKPITCAEWPIS